MTEPHRFAPGDHVRPRKRHRGDPTLPMGKVTRVFTYGQGQVLHIEGKDRFPYLSGYFELEPKRQ